MRFYSDADALIPSYVVYRFVDESRAIVSALSAEMKEVIAAQRNAALERKARVVFLPLGKDNFVSCFA